MNISDLNSIKEEQSNLTAKDVPLLQWCIDEYIEKRKEYLQNCTVKEAKAFLLSEDNRLKRKNMKSCCNYGMWIKAGDVVYADFGEAYLCEIGYQHLAIVLTVTAGKALIVPMSSNTDTVRKAYDRINNPTGNKHLMRIDECPYLHRESVLFLNDMKFISTARIISVKGNIDVNSNLYKEIYNRINECLLKTVD